MKIPLKLTLLTLVIMVLPLTVLGENPDQKLMKIIRNEIDRNLSVLSKQPVAATYISARIEKVFGGQVASSFGNTTMVREQNVSSMVVYVRVGDDKTENLFSNANSGAMGPNWGQDTMEVKMAVWRAISRAYNMALEKGTSQKSQQAILVAAPDKAPYFSSPISPSQFTCELLDPNKVLIPLKTMQEKSNKYSAEFLKNPDISNTNISYISILVKKYFIDSQGAAIAQNRVENNLAVMAEVVAKDGMTMPLYETYQVSNIADLPSDGVIMSDIKKISTDLSALKVAPLAEPYSGVALLSPKATGVFFHEFFGHRIEAARLKSQMDAGTFKNKVGEKIFSDDVSVIFDPTIERFEKQPLYGSYAYDDEGVKSERVDVVKDGKLIGFLTSRTPIDGFASSNGHGRGSLGATSETRQSNMFINSSKAKTDVQLREMLIAEIKAQGKEFGYYIDKVSGGYTSTMVFMPNVFNVSPLLIYKVWADGRKDELVRGVSLIGTPLAVFAQIMALGNRHEIFNGTCGASSGQVPVSAVAPAMLIRNLETQRATMPQLKPVILSRPDQKN